MMWRRQAGRVLRYHTYPTLQQQTVGEHTWQVLRIYTEVWGAPSGDVMLCILHHDSAERVTGDTPHHAKRRWSESCRAEMREIEDAISGEMGLELPDIPEADRRRIKIADLLEMWEFGQDESLLGSMHGELITQEVGRVLMRILDENPDPAVTEYMKRRQKECHTPIA